MFSNPKLSPKKAENDIWTHRSKGVYEYVAVEAGDLLIAE
jgi:hypothetical protein